MSEPDDPLVKRSADRYSVERILAPSNRGSLVIIGGIVIVVAVAFAYTGGFLSPNRLTPTKVVNQFEADNGVHPGIRRNHSKGVCFAGTFDADGSGLSLSKAQVFEAGQTPIFGRFATAVGTPSAPDGAASVRSMAVNFSLRDGEIWRTGMNDIPVFPFSNVNDFYAQLAANAPDPATGKPDPDKMKAFVASHPDFLRAVGLIKGATFSSGFADATYNSLNAFIFENSSGKLTPVRWAMVAEDPFKPDQPSADDLQDKSYLFDDFAKRVATGPVRYKLVATIGQPGDPTNNPSVAWPADRQTVQMGVMTINSVQDEEHGACRDVTFDPLILPAGIKGSDDPILSARSAAYAKAYVRRSGEPAAKSTVPVSPSVESPK